MHRNLPLSDCCYRDGLVCVCVCGSAAAASGYECPFFVQETLLSIQLGSDSVRRNNSVADHLNLQPDCCCLLPVAGYIVSNIFSLSKPHARYKVRFNVSYATNAHRLEATR